MLSNESTYIGWGCEYFGRAFVQMARDTYSPRQAVGVGLLVLIDTSRKK